MKAKAVRHADAKHPLMYAISPEFESEIRNYVDNIKRETGLPKSRIVTNVLIETIRQDKKFCLKLSENSEN